MKKILAVILVLSIALTACQKAPKTTETDTKKKLRIAWVNPLIGNPLYDMQDEGAKMGAEAYGVELTILGMPTIAPEQYAQSVENALADKYDGIVVCPYNPESMIPVLQRVKAAGVPVVFTIGDTPDNPELRTTLLGLDFKAFGAFQAESLAGKTGGKANIVWMQTSFDGIQNDFRAGFEKKLEEYPDMHLIVSEADSADLMIATQKFQDIFTAHPEIDAAVMCDVVAGSAAAKVAKEMKRDITVLAIDDIPETLDQIRNGEIWGTIAQNYTGMGYESVRLLVESLNGESVPAFKQVPLMLVTKENVDTYKDEMIKLTKTKGIPW